MSGPYLDLYAVCAERSVAAAQRFLDEWAPLRTLSAEELVFPYLADGGEVVSVDDLLARLERQSTQEYLIYWESGRSDDIEHVILGFTRDGAMIAGLSLGGGWEQPSTRVAGVLEKLAKSVDAKYGYVAAEEPPPLTRSEIVDECHQRELVWIDQIVDRRANWRR